jgi:hypothetical protein
MKQKNYIMKQNNDIIKQPMKNINTMKIMKKFLFLKIFFLALYSPTIFAITCSTGSGGGGSSSGPYSWSTATASAAFTARQGLRAVVFDNKMWVIGGNDGADKDDVWYSVDGKTWTEKTKDSSAKFPPVQEFSTIVHDGYMWVIGGFGTIVRDSVYRSTNGATWREVRADKAAGGFGPRYGHTSVVFDKKMWVIGGLNFSGGLNYLDDVWSSTNGITWEDETKDSSKKFSGRTDHSSIVHNNKIWVIGGTGGNSKSSNDVWSSEDGIAWEQEASNARFSIRSSHESVVFDNQMWVVGGFNSGGVSGNNKNDVWSSTNGVSWVESTATVGFSARRSHAMTVFEDAIWMIGGHEKIGAPIDQRNDVWSFSNK